MKDVMTSGTCNSLKNSVRFKHNHRMGVTDMTMSQIAYFIAMAEKLSFTAVSEQFHVTQPTLSRQIMNLEAELETPLFE